jgi:hypothetical protein
MVITKKAKAAAERIIPSVIDNPQLADYLEVMSVAIFQSGMSWASVLNNLAAYREAFKDFDPAKVSKFNQASIKRLLITPKILHSEKKIAAVIKNARILVALDQEYNGLKNYLRGFENYQELELDLHQRFEFMGPLNAYYFLFRTGEKVPPIKKWLKTIDGDHPRMIEMVAAKKDEHVA